MVKAQKSGKNDDKKHNQSKSTKSGASLCYGVKDGTKQCWTCDITKS